ncbi:hypothetical protein EJO69_00600 [Flaviflexus salsibiostraticola]|uniref:VTT domain-containing protein n=1 Tax=Flaviflexus salsibiostraticola TaxID=1282737 RepID=A0A3S8Z664_9ACTO|nr:VTT domain-containing protein [Flaviflexus salsibiostraticola]AZN28965.1 hypothetical protein EJO69_00600 [Flaviflexus salsibiostraticola]
MSEFFSTGPFLLVYLALLVIVFCRAQATYWIGYYVTTRLTKNVPETGWRRRFYTWSEQDSVKAGIDTIHRRGWIIIPLSFLTIGFQSIIQFAAGLIRFSPPRYTAAMLPGCMAWALIYSTIGFSVWGALIAAFAGSPYGIALLLLLVLIIVLGLRWRRRAQGRLIHE